MATAAPGGRPQKQDFSRDETSVIFASSLGTVFEWYDFYLYADARAVLRGAVLPRGQRDRGAALRRSPPTRRASWCGRSARWCSAASATWSGASTRSSSRSWSWASRRSRSACCRPTRRSAGLRRCSSSACACCRAWRSAASTAARRPTSPSTPRRQARLRHELDPDDGDAGPVPRADRHRHLPLRGMMTPPSSPNGAGAFRSWSR